MPLKEWRKHLPDAFELIVRRVTRRGKLVDFSVVLLYDGCDITRYDNEHDVPHRDVSGKNSGLIKKEWYYNMSNERAFEHALIDLSENRERYLAYYNAN
jgi:hypothetical protein